MYGRNTTRFLKALDTLCEIGDEWAPEIETELEDLDPEKHGWFVRRAGRAVGVLGVMVDNLLIDAEVRLPVREAAAAAR
jgi:hypothetical protein